MTDANHEHLRRLFDQAIELPPPARTAFLDTKCRKDPELKQRLLVMLAVAEGDEFLTSPTGRVAAPPAAEQTLSTPLREGPGTQIGPYKLLQQIGEGGFGVVFLAEQTEPMLRKVALKIIKLGMDTRQVVARFEQERQALAMMDHPNIARVLDAGATETGRPYFVMELCKGDPIVDYCDKNSLSIDERLDLMAQVCNAVQHAHGKGIIHRDLKPSNILVGTQDGRPNAKVIDFGIAKATSQKLTDKTLFTEHQQVIGTLQYMSPEQAEGSLDIDTRTDVYSLGVLLYELLTGSTPFDKKTLQNAMYGEIQRMIREVEPHKPSTRLSDSHDTIASIAARRRIEPKRLGVLVRGELDWIVMKALEKDRSRRYETANGLAMDIRRYLSGEDVVAAPPSASYRLRKFVRRHQGQVVAASLVMLVLVAGVIGTTFGMLEANRSAEQEHLAKLAAESAKVRAEEAAAAEAAAKRDAEQRRAEAEANLAFARKGNEILGSVFRGLDPTRDYGTVAELRAALRDNLTEAVTQLEGSAIGDPLEVAAMQQQLASSLLALGEAKAASEVFAKEFAVREERLGSDHADTLASANNLAEAWLDAGKLEEGLQLLEDTYARRKAKLGPEHPDTLLTLANLAGANHRTGRLDASLPLFEEALVLHRKVLGPEHAHTLKCMSNLAGGYVSVGRSAQAIPLYDEALQLQRQKNGPDSPESLSMLGNLAATYESTGQLDKALPLLDEALARRRTRLGADHPSTLSSLNNLASCHQKLGKVDRAVPLLEEALRILREKFGPDHPDTLKVTTNLATCYRERKQLDKALPLLEETLRVQRQKLGPEHPDTLTSMGNLAAAYWTLKQLDRSIPLFEEALRVQERKLGRSHPATVMTTLNLGVNYRTAGRYEDALPLLEDGWQVARKRPEMRGFGPDLLDTYVRLGKADAAEKLLAEIVAEQRAAAPAASPQLAGRLGKLGMVLVDAGAFTMAEPLLRENVEIRHATQPDAWQTFQARSHLGAALAGQRKFAEAEPLLLGGYEGMKAREHRIAARSANRLPEAIDRLVAFYVAAGRTAEAETWRAERAKLAPVPTPTEK
jgi:serine/threonine protein kinase